jgi:hypothetical protein
MVLSARSRMFLAFLVLVMGVSQASAQVPQAPTVTIGGLGYFQYAYAFQEDSLQKTVGSPNLGHQNNFDVTRAYINVIAKLPFGVGARITPDIITTRNNTVTGLILRMKYAYVSFTPNNGTSPLTFKFGEIQTPWLDWEEALWDYRMQGQMAMERAGYLASSDLGISIDGNYHYDKFNFTAGFYDGEFYSGIPGDSRKDAMARVSYKIFNTDQPGRVGGFRITAYGQYGKPNTGGERYRAIGELSYSSKLFLLAAEYGWAKDSVTGDSLSAPNTKPLTTGRVLSFYGVLRVPHHTQWNVILRYDVTDPNTAPTSVDNTTDRFIGGVAYQLSPNLRVLAGVDLAATPGRVYNNVFNAGRDLGLFQAQVNF